MIKETCWTCEISTIDKALNNFQLEDWRVAINKPTGDFFYDPWEIKEEFKGTPWDDILKSLGEVKGEARVICLNPSESYFAHADIDDRWHLNLSGEHSYLSDLSNLKMHRQIKDGRWSDMDAGNIHTASNFGSVPRNQLVVRKLLNRSKFNDMVEVSIEPAYEQFDFRYQFDNIYSPWLNKVNKEFALDNFKHTSTQVKFSLALHKQQELQNLSTNRFKVHIC